MIRQTIAIAIIATMVGCGTTDPGDTADNLIRSGGKAGADARTGDLTVPVAGAYMGDASSETVNAKADRTTSNAATFSQKAFDFAGAVTATGAAYAKMVEADPMVSALRAQLGNPDITPADRDGLLAQLGARLDKIQASLRAAGGDLSGLSSLTVVNTANHAGNSGHTTIPLTPEEAAAAATAIPSVVEKAKGGN